MPQTRAGRIVAVAYVLAVFLAVVVWMLAGLSWLPYSWGGPAFVLMMLLALPLSPVLLGFMLLGGLQLWDLGLGAGVSQAVLFVLFLVVMTGAAVVNVLVATAVRGACRWRITLRW